jgi:hypothetical protein
MMAGRRAAEVCAPIHVWKAEAGCLGGKLFAQKRRVSSGGPAERIEDDSMIRVLPLVARKLAKRMGARPEGRVIRQSEKLPQDLQLQFSDVLGIVRVSHNKYRANARGLLYRGNSQNEQWDGRAENCEGEKALWLVAI